MKTGRYILAASALAILGAAGAITLARADETEPAKQATSTEIPAEVRAAAAKACPGGVIGDIESENEDGTVMYEVKVRGTDGRSTELEMTADGVLVESGEDIAADALPAAVATTLKDLLPAGENEELEKKTLVVYEVERKVGGKSYEVLLDATGRVLKVEAEHESADDNDDERD